MYQTLPDKSKAAESAGLTSYEINSSRWNVDNYSDAELERALGILQSLEYGVKSGTIEEAIVLDYFVAMVI